MKTKEHSEKSRVEEEIKVSICCCVYNHEKYLKKCLDGFIMQKTNFRFEILIHDDASTDSSADIIREYEEKYSDIVKPVYQSENQYSKGVKISWIYQYPKAVGKYIALCEGDDYWCDPYKLQKQYDMLENSEEGVFCTHVVRSIAENGELLEGTHPHKRGDVDAYVSSEKWIRMLLSDQPYQFQTSCYFFRADTVKKYCNAIPDFISYAKVGDAPLMMLFAMEGDLYFINEEMSCYRNNSSGSWSQRYRTNQLVKISIIEAGIRSFKAYDEFTGYRYTELIDDVCRREEFKLLNVQHDYRRMMNKRYKSQYDSLSLKERTYVRIFGYVPWLRKYYLKLRKRNE